MCKPILTENHWGEGGGGKAFEASVFVFVFVFFLEKDTTICIAR